MLRNFTQRTQRTRRRRGRKEGKVFCELNDFILSFIEVSVHYMGKPFTYKNNIAYK